MNVYNVFVERGNVAVLHCGIPASVKDNVEIVGWWKDEGKYGRVELHTGGRCILHFTCFIVFLNIYFIFQVPNNNSWGSAYTGCEQE